MGKGSKRKTRWRTLSIGTPPGEEDEEEGLRNGYAKRQENDTGTHSFGRIGQSGYKPLRTGNSDGGAYAGAAARHKDDSSGSPSQPKIIFNEDEYTRITTPRQDMLFKKGYLSKKKPWAGNANTSATSSTTESQSASHSTADGSETTEDQQLLDRDCATGEYPPVMDSNAQLGYGTFYDHVGGYYYEYPVMLVGPAPMPAQVAPSVLAAVPCAPVPLRPIEWINPTFVPKLPGEPYCMMNYESNQSMEGGSSTVVVEEQENTVLAAENANGICNENGTRSTSCSGSVVGEMDERSIDFINAKEEHQIDEQAEERVEEHAEEQLEERYADEQQVEEQPLENGMNGDPYYDPMLMQQPMHVSHVIPTVSQPYMYPGHYMFGPPLINVNGVTIQSGLMIRTTEFATMSAAMSAAYAKRRKKKKRRKQRRFTMGNTEDEEEGEYSSECDTGLPSSEQSWTACSASTTITTTTTTTTATTTNNRPLNPECQEFQLRQVVEPRTSLLAIPTSADDASMFGTISSNQTSASSSDANLVGNESDATCNGVTSDDSKSRNDQRLELTSTSLENSRSKSLETSTSSNDESNRLTNCLPGDEEAALSTDEVAWLATDVEKLPSISETATNNDSPSANELRERPSNETNGGETLVNGKLDSASSGKNASMPLTTPRPLSAAFNDEKTRSSRSTTPKSADSAASREDQSHECLSSGKSSSSTSLSKRKYSSKGGKFVREPTPGPDLSGTTEPENETKVQDLTRSMEKMDLSNDAKLDCKIESHGNKATKVDQVSSKFETKTAIRDFLNKEAIEATNEDSGFESQTQLSDYPITEAVTEWLRKEKSPDLFITSAILMDCEEDEDEDDMDQEPPKNLQSNPMPALSVNSGADNTALSRAANCGEFAGVGNIKSGQEQQQQQQPDGSNNSGASRKKKDAKRRSEERRRVARHLVDDKVDHEVVSSSDSCGQRENLASVMRRRNLAKQQQQDVVDDVREFTEKDSVAGMRVASSSRMDSKRVNARRTKRQGKSHARNPSNSNIDRKIRRIEDVNDENDDDGNNDDGIVDDGIVEDTVNVRTFEKGEIIVSEDGKLLTSSTYEPSLRKCHDAPTTVKALDKSETVKQTTERNTEEKRKRSGSVEDEKSGSGIDSLDSIEEPDVLECWEAEIIEPLVTPKRMLQTEGILCEGEAAEDDTIEVEQVNVDYVQKYYRLARESATSSIEEISLKAGGPSTSSKSVPNMSKRKEEIPARNKLVEDESNVPIDEAFEVYESCYTGNSPFLAMDSKVFKSRTLYGQEGETPIPCKTVCCRIQ